MTMTEKLIDRRGAFRKWYEKVKNGEEKPEILKFRPTDVLILGPPKSGTTWLQQILHQIRTGGDEDFSDIYDITKICPMYITGFPGYQIDGEQKATPRIFKGHSGYNAIPKVDGMKYVVVLRDPVDAIWSFVKFGTRFYGFNRDMTTEELKEIYGNPSFDLLDPWHFTISWLPHINDPNVLWLHYEDLILDLKFCILKLAEFLGFELTEIQLDRIHNFCTFNYMSARKNMFSGGEWLDALMSLSNNHNGWESQLGMVRADGGKVGQGGKLMQPDMKEYVMTSWAESVGKALGFDTYQQLYEQNSILKKKI